MDQHLKYSTIKRRHLKYSTSGHSEGPFIPSVDIPAKVGTSAWGSGFGVTSFSNLLPVPPHEKLNFTDSELGGQSVEHPYGEHPSRTLFVRNINSNVEDSELRSLFEQYGGIRTLYTACKHMGFVMISYYDIRDALTAMHSLQKKPLRRRKLDIHFSIPKDNPSEKDIYQGTLAVFNLDPSVSNDDLRQIFGAYGDVKEIRETPRKRHAKFIEFYDVRGAEAALRALNESDIAGKRIKPEPSRHGVARRNLMQQLSQELEQDEIRSFRHHVGSPVTTSPPGEGSEKQITSEPEEVAFDVEAVQMTSNFSEMKFEIEEFEIEPEAVDIDQHVSDTIIQPKEVLMQGGLGLIEPPKNEDWKNVKEIYLMHNELSGNPRHPMPLAPFLHKRLKLTSFDALQTLDLSKTGIRSLPESIVRLVNLKRLILSYCHHFMRLSPKVGELKQLEVLDLEGTEITDLPENLRCPKLLELFLHKNHKLRTIPPSFFDYMPALQVLNLSRTGIRSLPESIVRLVSLKCLFLSYCHHLKRLSPKVGELNQLEVLDLEGTEIKDLPENPRFFMLLAPFFQNDNKLRTIPFSSFDALQILNLSRTDIRSLPESIFRLINLKRLILSYCHRLRRLSHKVGELKQLKVLDLEGTEIMDFPEEIKKLTNLICLKFSFYGYVGDGSSAMQSDAVVPCGVISNLSHLEELMISVNPNDKQWNACVEDIVKEVCTLESLNTLLFYFPKVELVKHFLLNSPVWVYQSLFYFRFIVGDHVKRIMSRLPRDVEPELERWERCLKYINGVAIPTEIKEVLQYSDAFFLERHAIVKKLSDFGIENMKQLKCCVVGECNDVEVIIDETVDHEEDSEANAREEEADAHEEDDEVEAYREDGSSEIVSKTFGAEKIVLGSLEYLCIYYMKNLRTIWKGPVQPKCLSLLKSLTLRTCPQLTTIFTRGLLENLYNLEELTIEDCPSIKTLVSFEVSAEHKTSHFLPNLKWISLHYMPKLDTISSGLHIAPRLEWLSFYNCPNLKNPLIEEVSSKDLKKIKGERSWWEALEWRSGRPAYLDDIFVPINIWDC